MRPDILANSFRFVLLFALQVLIFKDMNVEMGGLVRLHILLYSLFILLLPIPMPTYLVLLLGFGTGLLLDVFYDSLGVHASATVFLAFLRKASLNLQQPKGGYTRDHPTFRDQSIAWFFRYATPLVALHVVFYFMVEAFNLYLLPVALLKALVSFLATMVFIALYMFIFNPKA